MTIGPSIYCSRCDDSSTHDPCYYCLMMEYTKLKIFCRDMFRAFKVALVEAESEVTVASCLRSLLDSHK